APAMEGLLRPGPGPCPELRGRPDPVPRGPARRGPAYPARPPVRQRLRSGARRPARGPSDPVRGTHRYCRGTEHDRAGTGVRDGESLGQRASLHLGDRESEGHARPHPSRRADPRRHARHERSRGGGQAVRQQPERDRRAEQQDRQLREEARVARRRGGRPTGRSEPPERPAPGLRARRRNRAVSPPAATGVTRVRIVLTALGRLSLAHTALAADNAAAVSWHPSKPRVGDVAWVLVKDVLEGAAVEGSVDGKPLTFFPYAGGQAAIFGFDLETKPGTHS